MSLAYVLFCLWLLAALAAGAAPRRWRGQARLSLLAAGGALVVLALVSQGLMTGLFAATGVLAVFPEPLALAREWLLARLARARASAA